MIVLCVVVVVVFFRFAASWIFVSGRKWTRSVSTAFCCGRAGFSTAFRRGRKRTQLGRTVSFFNDRAFLGLLWAGPSALPFFLGQSESRMGPLVALPFFEGASDNEMDPFFALFL